MQIHLHTKKCLGLSPLITVLAHERGGLPFVYGIRSCQKSSPVEFKTFAISISSGRKSSKHHPTPSISKKNAHTCGLKPFYKGPLYSFEGLVMHPVASPPQQGECEPTLYDQRIKIVFNMILRRRSCNELSGNLFSGKNIVWMEKIVVVTAHVLMLTMIMIMIIIMIIILIIL